MKALLIESPSRPEASTQDVSPLFRGVTAAEAQIVQRILKHEGTPEAIREFARCRTRLSDYIYWFVLGTLWVSYTGFSDLDLWKRLFASARPDRDLSLMKPSELQELCALPDPLLIYRAHRPNEADWIAYTLSLDVAARFARERGVSEIKAYGVKRTDVLALFLRRGEQEILVLDRHKPQFIKTIEIIREGEKMKEEEKATT